MCFEKNYLQICFCPPGFAGDNCEFPFKMHNSNVCNLKSPCKNNAKCVPQGNDE